MTSHRAANHGIRHPAAGDLRDAILALQKRYVPHSEQPENEVGNTYVLLQDVLAVLEAHGA